MTNPETPRNFESPSTKMLEEAMQIGTGAREFIRRVLRHSEEEQAELMRALYDISEDIEGQLRGTDGDQLKKLKERKDAVDFILDILESFNIGGGALE